MSGTRRISPIIATRRAHGHRKILHSAELIGFEWRPPLRNPSAGFVATMIINEYGLSLIQEAMPFHQLSGEARGVDIDEVVVGYNEPLDSALLERAWHPAVERHPALRASLENKLHPNPVP
jgi:hypothetical protein